jgi:ribosomal protein S18 acetylase RimI-like enzyme
VQGGSALWPRRPVAIELEVRPDNTRAIAFYEGLGFEHATNAHMRLPLAVTPDK